MTTKHTNPMPTVTYNGKTYKLRSRKTIVPDLESMEGFGALVWLIQNTTRRGYSKNTNPLAGWGGTLEIR